MGSVAKQLHQLTNIAIDISVSKQRVWLQNIWIWLPTATRPLSNPRLGLDPWLQPYTDKTVAKMAKSGVKKMAIVTPAFVSDCLETLEEIGMEAVEDFEEKGGEHLHVIPCINDREDWVNVMSRWRW